MFSAFCRLLLLYGRHGRENRDSHHFLPALFQPTLSGCTLEASNRREKMVTVPIFRTAMVYVDATDEWRSLATRRPPRRAPHKSHCNVSPRQAKTGRKIRIAVSAMRRSRVSAFERLVWLRGVFASQPARFSDLKLEGLEPSSYNEFRHVRLFLFGRGEEHRL